MNNFSKEENYQDSLFTTFDATLVNEGDNHTEIIDWGSNVTTFTPLEDEMAFRYPPMVALIILTSALILTTFTIVGNILIITAFCLERPLRQVSNFLVISLSLSDFLIGVTSTVPFALSTVVGWPFDRLSCHIWLVWDRVLFTISQLSAFMYAIDRYLILKSPNSYRCLRTKIKIFLVLCCLWILSFLNYALTFVFLVLKAPTSGIQGTKCKYAKIYPVVNLLLQVICFWIPVIVMCQMYSFSLRVHKALNDEAVTRNINRQQLARRSAPTAPTAPRNSRFRASYVGQYHPNASNNSSSGCGDSSVSQPHPNASHNSSSGCGDSSGTQPGRMSGPEVDGDAAAKKYDSFKSAKGVSFQGSGRFWKVMMRKECSGGKENISDHIHRMTMEGEEKIGPCVYKVLNCVRTCSNSRRRNMDTISDDPKLNLFNADIEQDNNLTHSRIIQSCKSSSEKEKGLANANNSSHVSSAGKSSSAKTASSVGTAVADDMHRFVDDKRLTLSATYFDKTDSFYGSVPLKTRASSRKEVSMPTRPNLLHWESALNLGFEVPQTDRAVCNPVPLALIQNRAQKAVRANGFILGAFVLSYGPFAFLQVFKALTQENAPAPLFDMFLFLHYFNSALNPFMYAYVNPLFRRTIRRIVLLDFHRNRRVREEFTDW